MQEKYLKLAHDLRTFREEFDFDNIEEVQEKLMLEFTLEEGRNAIHSKYGIRGDELHDFVLGVIASICEGIPDETTT